MKYAMEIHCLPVAVPFGYRNFLQFVHVSSGLSFSLQAATTGTPPLGAVPPRGS